MKHIKRILFGGLFLAATVMTARAQFLYITNNGTITITGYTGSGGSVTIPSTINGLPVTVIGSNAFRGTPVGSAYLISSVTVPGSVTNIGDYAFLNDFYLTTVNLSAGLISIGSNAFSQCGQLKNISIPATVTTMGDFAFNSDRVLANINLPNGLVHIGSAAFGFTALSSVTLPPSVTDLGDNPFESCSSLSAISVATNNPAYTNVNGVLFDKNQAALLCYPAGHPGSSYTISNTVTTIGATAFEGCTGLFSVVIPPGVTSIDDGAFFGCAYLTNISIPVSVQAIGVAPFGNCIRLTAINVDTNNLFYTSGDGVLFDSAETQLIAYPAAGPIKSYAIPATVTNIGNSAFSGVGPLTSVTIPGSVINIGQQAFYNGLNLSNVSLAAGLKNIGSAAFYNCMALQNVSLPGTVTSMGDGAFYFCLRLGSITIPASITNLGPEMFGNCTGLTNAILNDGVTDISEFMFGFCSSLASVTIPASVTNIAASAFSSDPKLTAVYFEGGPPGVGQSAFGNPSRIYYLPNVPGWGTNYAGRPAAVWQPAISTGDGFFGQRNGQFGFNISWASNYTVTVQANSDLTGTNWTPLQSCTLTNGTFYFSDAGWVAHPNRFYRLTYP